MKRTTLRTTVLAASLAAVIGVGGAAAYFSDTEQAANTFTVGSIGVTLTEAAWTAWKESGPDPIVPDQEIPKDPVVANNGDNDAYVFMSVKVPTANIVTAAENGARQAAAETQLFGYTPDSNWTLVSSDIEGAGAISLRNATGGYGVHAPIPASQVSPAPETAPLGYVTYVYAYTGSSGESMQRLAPANSAPALFNAVQFVNAVEGQGLENAHPAITVRAYAIQADFINDGDTAIDGTNGGSPASSPAAVWQVIKTQGSVVL